MDRASDYGSEGWGFESLQARFFSRDFGGAFKKSLRSLYALSDFFDKLSCLLRKAMLGEAFKLGWEFGLVDVLVGWKALSWFIGG